MKIKNYLILLFLVFSSLCNSQGYACTIILNPEVISLYNIPKNSENKLPVPKWNFCFTDEENIYQFPLIKVDTTSKKDIAKRYHRMVHSAFVKDKTREQILKKILKLSSYSEMIAAYLKEKLDPSVTVQHISLYGSFLYNSVDPDDVDLMVIVESPERLRHSFETTLKEITGEETSFPKISFHITDKNTFTKVKNYPDTSLLTSAERIAQHHLAMGSSWYLTIFGYDLGYDNPKKLKDNDTLNYLKKSFESIQAAGARFINLLIDFFNPSLILFV